ncbi:MAG: hypothetical protein ACE5IY_18430 [bacterium]
MMAIKNFLSLLLIFGGTTCFAYQDDQTDSNIPHAIADIERKLQFEIFELRKVAEFTQLRLQANFAHVILPKRVTLRFGDGTEMNAKWKTSEKGGEAFNNQPRYEIAAYEFQKLFLEPEEFVVPPTVARCLHIRQCRGIERNAKPTFKKTDDVFFVLQYWLSNVTPENVFDEARFASDSVYARYFANMNVFSYLVKHSDSNRGNMLISSDPGNPRVFAVDNGLAFGKALSDRGTEWQQIVVKRLPEATIERLRSVTRQDIEETLGVVAQFEVQGGRFVCVPVTDNLNPKKGVRQKDSIVQFGLTQNEIAGIVSRLGNLLRKVDSGKIQTF